MRYEDYQVEVVTGVAFAVVWLGVLVLGFQSLLLDLALGGIGGWTLYRAFGGIVYGRARHAWQKAAETLDLEFYQRHDSEPTPAAEFVPDPGDHLYTP
ncbi:MAG: hypothetical protein ABEK29_03210, partial [Bradymonadaceae bacterium]